MYQKRLFVCFVCPIDISQTMLSVVRLLVQSENLLKCTTYGKKKTQSLMKYFFLYILIPMNTNE
jgi:hypothetical protein